MSRVERRNRVRSRREERGLTQVALAEVAGISRQSLSAIEAGRSEPSVSLGMRIASVLDQRVEELFGSDDERASIEAELVNPGKRQPGEQRVALARIRDRWLAYPLGAGRIDSLSQSAGGLWLSQAGPRRGKARVELLESSAAVRDRVILTGCAPALGVLVQRLNSVSGPGRFSWFEQSSTAALKALKQGHAHVAGIHWHERSAAEPNVAAVRRNIPKTALTLVTLASWQAGLLFRPGNPLRIRAVADLARSRIRIAARERGAGARLLLEQQLQASGLDQQAILEKALVVHGQLDVGQAIALGAADTGLAMAGAAVAYDLDFLPLVEERFDLVIPSDAATDPRFTRLLDLMSSGSFRRELASLGGYDAANCGATAAEIHIA